jgi:hypothetical protein
MQQAVRKATQENTTRKEAEKPRNAVGKRGLQNKLGGGGHSTRPQEISNNILTPKQRGLSGGGFPVLCLRGWGGNGPKQKRKFLQKNMN